MSATALSLLIALGGALLSILCSAFVAGMGWQRVNSEMRYMNDRLAKIEGMFILTPANPSHTQQSKP